MRRGGKLSGTRIEARIENVDELMRDLKQLGINTKKTHKGAVRRGTNVIRAAAEQRAAVLSSRSGRKVRARVRTRQGYIVGSVFPGKGFAHLRLQEYGTKRGWRWARKKGPFKFYAGKKLIVTRLIRHPGTDKRPWLKPAFDASTGAALAAYGDALRAAIEEAKIEPEGNDV